MKGQANRPRETGSFDEKSRPQEACGRVFVEICDAENGAGIHRIDRKSTLSSSASHGSSYTGYFSEVLIVEKVVLRVEPSLLTVAMMARLMPAAISPYSIAVAPDSSARNLRNIFFKTRPPGTDDPEILPRFLELDTGGQKLK
jgi:hypothetical protein